MARTTPRVTSWSVAPGSLAYPLVIAHRGCSGVAPENTLEAFRSALEVGADGVELDVRLTRDGEVVVIHDRRMERTTTGKGPIGATILAEARTLDAGSWFDPRFKSAREPTLREVFEELPRQFLIDVEIKANGHGAWPLVSRVVSLVRSYDRLESTLVASFNPVALWALRVQEPRIARGYIWSKRLPLPLRARWLSPLAGPHWMKPARYTFTPELLKRFRRQGKPVLARDVDITDDIEHLARMGLDGIISDHPEALIKYRT